MEEFEADSITFTLKTENKIGIKGHIFSKTPTLSSVSSSYSAVMDELIDYGVFRGPSVMVRQRILTSRFGTSLVSHATSLYQSL